MPVKWKKLLAENPQFLDESIWDINITDIKTSARKDLIRNLNICYEMRVGSIGRVVADKYNVTPPYITYLMQRVFSVDENGEYLLTRALIPNNRLFKSKRNSPLGTKNTPRGNRCSLQHTIDAIPDWYDELYQLVIVEDQRQPYAINLTPNSFWQLALTGLKSRSWPMDTWPFNTPSQGYQTFRRLLDSLRNELAKNKSQKRRSCEGTNRSDLVRMPFDEVQIDWQVCDKHCRLSTECEGDIVDTRLERCCLLVAFCVKTRCVLAWHLALTRNPSHEDILQVIDNIYSQRLLKIRVTPDLEHAPNANYPSAVIPEMHMIGINTISMDNAWANMARMVADKVCQNGTLLRFGKGNTPIDRSFVESVFFYINGLTHRFASTTGSHPSDPIKESTANAKKAPEISIQSFKELLDVWISKYNADPKVHNMGESPLQRLERYYRTEPIRFSHNLRHTPRDFFSAWYPATVYAPKVEPRKPEIKHQGIVYRGNKFTDRDLGGKSVRIKKDKRDIRSIEVYTNEGQRLAKLYAQSAYLHYPLSERTYNRVKEFKKNHGTAGLNPVIAYMRHVFLNRGAPRQALEFVRIAEEIKNENMISLNEPKINEIPSFDTRTDIENIAVTPISELMDKHDFGAH